MWWFPGSIGTEKSDAFPGFNAKRHGVHGNPIPILFCQVSEGEDFPGHGDFDWGEVGKKATIRSKILYLELVEFPVKGPTADSQLFRGIGPVSRTFPERMDHQLFFRFLERQLAGSQCLLGGLTAFFDDDLGVSDGRWKILRFHHVPAAKDHRVFDGGPEFANVSRPPVTEQEVERLGRETGHGLFVFPGVFLEERRGEDRNV